MQSVPEVLRVLKTKGNAQTCKIYEQHGAPPLSMYGVRVADLKAIAKKIKGEQLLACELYDTGNSDAMYLAGLVADGGKMTKKQLDSWAKKASWYMISEYTVPWVAAESRYGRELACKWMDSKKERVASCGWATYASVLSVTGDDELDLQEIKRLLQRVEKEIASAANRVRYTMNGFVISVGAYVAPLLTEAKSTAKKIGKVSVDMGGTACKVPEALPYIEKIEATGRVGKKRQATKC